MSERHETDTFYDYHNKTWFIEIREVRTKRMEPHFEEGTVQFTPAEAINMIGVLTDYVRKSEAVPNPAAKLEARVSELQKEIQNEK